MTDLDKFERVLEDFNEVSIDKNVDKKGDKHLFLQKNGTYEGMKREEIENVEEVFGPEDWEVLPLLEENTILLEVILETGEEGEQDG